MNKHLMGIIIEALVFLELSDDEAINPDFAIQQTELIVSKLDKLNASEKTEFIEFIKSYTANARTAGSSNQRIEFIKNLPSAIGLEN
jgi:hypothetical protein